MKLKLDSKNITNYAFLIISGILFVLGAVGTYKNDAVILSIVNSILFIGIKLIQNVKINIPKYFYLYLLFLLTLFMHNLFFNGRFDYFFMFLSGGLYWLHFYNMRDWASKYFPYFLIFLGVLMFLLFIYSHIRGVYFLGEINLFLPVSATVKHNHIGDLWSIILVWTAYMMTHKIHKWNFLLILTGIFTIVISLSRSAIVALGIGAAYIFYTLQDKKVIKKYFYAILGICFLLFICFGVGKTTLFARPYFLQGLDGLIKYPFGTGIGNFSMVSSDSSLAHNIILEVVSGVGVYSVVFILWLVKIFQPLFKKGGNTLYIALFLTLSANFMFDTTYTVPTMLWLWFATLALIEPQALKSNVK
jgi:hypothetical protein